MAIVTILIAGALLLMGCAQPTSADASSVPQAAPTGDSAEPLEDRAPGLQTAATSTSNAEHQGSPQSAAPSRPVADPVAVEIPAIGVRADVVALGLNEDRTLEVPTDFDDAGWYTGRPPPGATGPAIIAGHVDSTDGPAVFYRLHDLAPGDEVLVHREDMSTARFTVDRVEQYAKNEFPTGAVYGPTAAATLRLITCGGSFDQRRRSYNDNIVVFARLEHR